MQQTIQHNNYVRVLFSIGVLYIIFGLAAFAFVLNEADKGVSNISLLDSIVSSVMFPFLIASIAVSLVAPFISVLPWPLYELIKGFDTGGSVSVNNPLVVKFFGYQSYSDPNMYIMTSEGQLLLLTILGFWALLGGCLAVYGARRIRAGDRNGALIWRGILVMSALVVVWNILWSALGLYSKGDGLVIAVFISVVWFFAYLFFYRGAVRSLKVLLNNAPSARG